ncbi:MAG: hypothetical protein NW206_06835 [Hyphomonadaceae bacterium]|nr:hypothetical protein [Hyphomonadaceae bacterium]
MVEEVKVERDLYLATMRFVSVSFIARLRELSPLPNLQAFPSNTSLAAGAEGGQWTRPDVAALVLGRGRFVPHWRADLHTFEVKTASGLNETAVHEANAHGRFSNYAWLVFQAVGKSCVESDLVARKITRLASHLGVGVIHFEDPESPHAWKIELWPKRTGTDASTADRFVAERFDHEMRVKISSNLRALGWLEE